MKASISRLRSSTRRGIALLTVLALLTLTSILILAFFSISQTELRSTSAYAAGAEAQQVAKTAVDLVMHQIRAATQDSGAAWASQPGMIRAWGKHGGSETVAGYKLYSDNVMTVRDTMGASGKVPAAFSRALYEDFADLQDWDLKRNKDVFVDLNEPILRAHVDEIGRERVKVYYPIVDPRAYVKGAEQELVSLGDWETPSTNLEDKNVEVEGFYFETNSVRRSRYPRMSGEKIDHFVGLPMPVRWLYQLKDGTLGTLDRVSAVPKFEKVSGDGTPSQANPIVARIAFWTDDESCKLNVNTAAGGSPWDTPRAGGITDREDFAAKPPVQKEFQRYPGHPATTSLAPVLFPNRPRAGRAGGVDVATAHEKIYEMIPRVQPGGSKGGLDFWTTNQPPIVDVDRDRLYATIDEFLFHATRKNLQGLREPQDAAGSWGQLDGEFLDRTKFFLTTASRSPEVTVFNTPRISVWPTYYEPNYSRYLSSSYYTQFDKQIRFCAEIGSPPNQFGDQYHFQRKEADSPTEDYDMIPRNKELFSYLLWLMDQDIPGIGASIQDKYGSQDTHQIATQIFDYIRCINLFDDMVFEDNKQAAQTRWTDNVKDHLAFTNNRVSEGDKMQVHKGHGQVTPIEIGSSKGFGRFYTINEVGIAFIATASIPDPAQEPGIRVSDGEKQDDEANASHILGGKRVWNHGFHASNSAAWTRYPWQLPADVVNWDDNESKNFNLKPPFDFTNVPPFSDVELRTWTADAIVQKYWWDGRTLDTSKAADQNIIAKQQVIAGVYGVDPSVFEMEKTRLQMKDRYNYILNKRNWNYTLERDRPLQFPGDCRVQAILLFSMFSPSKGWTAINPDYRLKVQISGFSVNGNALFDPVYTPSTFDYRPPASIVRHWNQRPMGGLLEPRSFLVGQGSGASLNDQMSRYTPDFEYWKDEMKADFPEASPTYFDRVGSADKSITEYPWVSRPITIQAAGEFNFDGGTVELELYSGGGHGAPSGAVEPSQPTQKVKVVMEACKPPRPKISKGSGGQVQDGVRRENTQTNCRETWCFSHQGAFIDSGGRLGTHPGDSRRGNLGQDVHYRGAVIYGGGTMGHADGKMDVVRSYVIPHGDYRLTAAKKELTSEGSNPDFVPHVGYNDTNNAANFPPSNEIYAATAFSTTSHSGGYGRDEMHIEYQDYKRERPSRQNINLLVTQRTSPDYEPRLEAAVPRNMRPNPNSPAREEYASLWGDWDNTTAIEKDGCFINKPDEGNSRNIAMKDYVNENWRRYGYAPRQFLPYFTEPHQQEAPGASFFSPNRIMPGPGMLGSLPTGVVSNKPWQTLLFRPLPSSSKIHPGAEKPKDHYLLDFFWMPVVEPWSISEPFSTAGKVNMNYALQPFAHIKRASGIIGAMYAEQMLTIPSDQQRDYKVSWGFGSGYKYLSNTGGTLHNTSLRSWIDHKETLKQFDSKFAYPDGPRIVPSLENQGDIFRTASELCEMWLVPDPILPPAGSTLSHDFTLTDIANWWDPDNANGFTLVGDNSRERPYTTLLARLTTKSNTFQVHYRAQIIKQSPMSPTNAGQRRDEEEYKTFDSDVDGVLAEYRGSTIIERFIDPNDDDDELPDYAKLADSNALRLGNFKSLDQFYRFRVVSEKRFAP